MLLIFHLLLNCNTFNKFLLKLKNEDKLFIMQINSNNSTSYISYSWIVTIQFWSTFLLTQLFILTFHFLNDAPCVSSYFLLGEQIQSNQSIIIRSQTMLIDFVISYSIVYLQRKLSTHQEITCSLLANRGLHLPLEILTRILVWELNSASFIYI